MDAIRIVEVFVLQQRRVAFVKLYDTRFFQFRLEFCQAFKLHFFNLLHISRKTDNLFFVAIPDAGNYLFPMYYAAENLSSCLEATGMEDSGIDV